MCEFPLKVCISLVSIPFPLHKSMGVCGCHSSQNVLVVPVPTRSNPDSIAALRVRIIELKKMEKVPILALERNKLHVRRLLGQETMAESSEVLRMREEIGE